MDTENHISTIYNKLLPKLKRLAALEKENQQHKELIRQLTEKAEHNQQQLKNFQEQIYLLKAASNTLSPQEKAGLEQTINKYIREIDKCINILSE